MDNLFQNMQMQSRAWRNGMSVVRRVCVTASRLCAKAPQTLTATVLKLSRHRWQAMLVGSVPSKGASRGGEFYPEAQ